jgi:hypothetical protein
MIACAENLVDSSEDRIQRETTAEAEWTAKEERSLVRKLDLRVLLPCCVIYFFAYVDRGNLYVPFDLHANGLGELTTCLAEGMSRY